MALSIAKEFSSADLKSYPSTEKVMSFFSDDAVFSQPGYPVVGKRVASWAFYYFCERSVVSFVGDPSVQFEEMSDHIVWRFDSIQVRKGWFGSEETYRIKNVAHLYFTGNKISRYKTVENTWRKWG